MRFTLLCCTLIVTRHHSEQFHGLELGAELGSPVRESGRTHGANTQSEHAGVSREKRAGKWG